jgi:hypothetical protein
MGGFDVKKTQLICASSIIGLGLFHRIACINQIDEVDTFDRAALGNVKAGDDAGF